MYCNDSVSFLLNGHYTPELWLTRGVKQGMPPSTNYLRFALFYFSGCNLSPLLFAIFLNGLGSKLNSTGLGIDLQGTNIAAIFFADDIALIARSDSKLQTLITITRTYFSHHHLMLSESKSKTMLFDASSGKITFTQTETMPELTLEKVLLFKYLGIPLSVSPYGLFKSFNDQARRKAQTYLHGVLSLVRTGPDRSELAHTLWTQCALPSILYGCEIIPMTQGTINEISRSQALVGKFILQLPRNSTNVCSALDAGLKPVWSCIAEKTLLYAHDVMLKKPSYWARMAMTENIALGSKSPYLQQLLKWKKLVSSFGQPRSKIKDSVHTAAVVSVLKEQQALCVSMFAMNGPSVCSKTPWFRPKRWVCDSPFSQIFAQFRACNAGLGNRGPTKDGNFFKLCPLCKNKGILALNNEVTLPHKIHSDC